MSAFCCGGIALAVEGYGFERKAPPTDPPRGWRPRRPTTAFVRARFGVAAASLDFVTVTATAVAIATVYHAVFYRVGGMAEIATGIGSAMAALFVLLNTIRGDYAIVDYLRFAGHLRRMFLVWNVTFATALVFVFAMKETALVSRASTLLLYGFGFPALVLARAALVIQIRRMAAAGRIALLRVVLVGAETELRDFNDRYQPWTVGVEVVASTVLRGADTLDEDLALAAAIARVLRPDDVFILSPWSETEVIDAAVTAFMNVPAAIHLGPQHVLDRFTKANVARIGPIASLHLVCHPLTTAERVGKRVADFGLAALLLVVFLPLFVLIAVAVRLDSRGPVFFVQRRYGFNQQTFRILKFRSMHVLEDDETLRQAVPGDVRVTKVGRWLRRSNLDELPQLLNVLRGEMSLVGPRPHALAHNRQYERVIADYARRHNVKPGITGWAQIHGLRGATESEGVMRARVNYDLFYIDNWSVGLDIRILGQTLLSSKAFLNAY